MSRDIIDVFGNPRQHVARLPHQTDALGDLNGTFADQGLDLLCGLGRTLGQGAHLGCDDGKTAPCLARSCGLNPGVQGQQVGLERPGLKRLLADVEDGLVDVVVVYKIDRLSRSLMDFSRLVDLFDKTGVTFVSVTQSFNTTTSMGRLTLNILLSFAQFEREVTGERIRDKIAASRKKGMWMGGTPPLGYEVKDRKLVVKDVDANHVRWIFARFIEIGSGTVLARELTARAIKTSRGNRIDKKYLYRLLNNRTYIGEAVHKGNSYPGEHEAIIDRGVWDKVHAILTESPRKRAARTRANTPALLRP